MTIFLFDYLILPLTRSIFFELWLLAEWNNIALSVYSIDGRLVYTEKINSTQNKHTINLSEQPSGVYFIKMISDEGVVVKKLVIE